MLGTRAILKAQHTLEGTDYLCPLESREESYLWAKHQVPQSFPSVKPFNKIAREGEIEVLILFFFFLFDRYLR